jgi:diguanylate cyclase (GGDEF)-like protein
MWSPEFVKGTTEEAHLRPKRRNRGEHAEKSPRLSANLPHRRKLRRSRMGQQLQIVSSCLEARQLTRDDPDRPAVAGTAVPRRVSYALIGACLAQGAAAGLLLFRLGDRRHVSLDRIGREVASDLGTYAYVAVSTTAAFSLFGGFVGHYADQLAQLASTDSLTGLLNARAFRARFHQEVVRAMRYRQPLSLLIADVDGLKRVNDEYGHEAGDEALRRVAAAIRNGLREADLGARVGGDEFAVVGPNTNEPAAIILAERLRALVARGTASTTQRGTTVSIGIASLVPSDRDASTELALMRAADAALYQAKRDGGNAARVVPSHHLAATTV